MNLYALSLQLAVPEHLSLQVEPCYMHTLFYSHNEYCHSVDQPHMRQQYEVPESFLVMQGMGPS